jgi:hypothetical protein
MVKSNSEKIVALRAGKRLDADEYFAHLAALSRLENVGVLVGAGASKSNDLGGKAVSEVWKEFSEQNKTELDWLKKNKFVSDTSAPNLERLLDQLNIAREYHEQKGDSQLAEVEKVIVCLRRKILDAAFLDKKLWGSQAEVESVTSEKLVSHIRVLQKICGARQPGQPSPWIFTTNYDLAVEWSAEAIGLHVNNGFSGVHNRVFSPHNFELGYLNTLAKGEARFGIYSISLVKLHGSLTWRAEGDNQIVEEPSRMVLGTLQKFIAGETSDPDRFLIFPEASKYLQTSAFVFGELFRRFSEFLSKAQSCLIVNGYSFGDEHLNRVLRAALHNPTLQLVLYSTAIKLEQATGKTTAPGNPFLTQLLNLALPQITFVGGGEQAYFDQLAEHLPDPAIFDEQSERIRKILKERNKPDEVKQEAQFETATEDTDEVPF